MVQFQKARIIFVPPFVRILLRALVYQRMSIVFQYAMPSTSGIV